MGAPPRGRPLIVPCRETFFTLFLDPNEHFSEKIIALKICDPGSACGYLGQTRKLHFPIYSRNFLNEILAGILDKNYR